MSFPQQFNEFVAASQFLLSVNSGRTIAAEIREPVSSEEYWITFSHDMNGLSAISYL
jgi:hypothetical protein